MSKKEEEFSFSKSEMWKWGVIGLILCIGGYVGCDMNQQPDRNKRTGLQSLYNTKEVSSGMFTTGCTNEQGEDCSSLERPAHKVTISRGFVLMESEVTQSLYEKVMGVNPSHFKGKDRPVERVSWFDAVQMANKLSVMEGLEECYSMNGKDVQWSNENCTGWRLPTEAEWEYAARGGEHFKYAGSNNVDEVAWYGYDKVGIETHDVCGKTRNGYGLCDMSGNVWEWVWDRYGNYESSSLVDPQGPTNSSSRVVRGGSWADDVQYIRVSNRSKFEPTFTSNLLGFRLARTSL